MPTSASGSRRPGALLGGVVAGSADPRLARRVVSLLTVLVTLDFADRAALGAVAPVLQHDLGLALADLGLLGAVFGLLGA